MSDDKQIPNPFQKMGSGPEVKVKRRGRPPVNAPKESKPAVGVTKRKPVGLRGTDKTPTRKGYRRRWVNDKEDRVKMFVEGGYTPVKDEGGKARTRRSQTGAGPVAVLMEIDENLYNGDQELKYDKWNQDCQERLTPRDGGGFYKPKSKI